MKRFAIAVMLLLIGSTMNAQQTRVNPVQQLKAHPEDKNAEEMLIHTLQSVLNAQGNAIRIYVHGTCQMNEPKEISFPAFDIHTPRKSETGIDAIREIFRNDKNVMITQDGAGVIRIVIGDVFRSFLDINLTSVHLDKIAQYNPDGPEGAIASIENESIVEKSMHKLKVSWFPVFYIGLRMPPLAGSRHLPASLNNMTVDQSLDLIAKTFAGVVVYSECMVDGSRYVDIGFDWFGTKPTVYDQKTH